MRETTAISRYQGLLTAFRWNAGTNGTADAELHAEPQPDRLDQRPRRGRHPAEPAEPRRRSTPTPGPTAATSSRRPTSTSSRSSGTRATPRLKHAPRRLAGSGITYANSGQPVSRISVLDEHLPARRVRRPRRASRSRPANVDQWGTPNIGSTRRPSRRRPTARSATRGARRSASRASTRWDLTLSKNFYLPNGVRLQFRADFINAFNQVNWVSDPNANGPGQHLHDARHDVPGSDRHLRPADHRARAARDPAGVQDVLVGSSSRQ